MTDNDSSTSPELNADGLYVESLEEDFLESVGLLVEDLDEIHRKFGQMIGETVIREAMDQSHFHAMLPEKAA